MPKINLLICIPNFLLHFSAHCFAAFTLLRKQLKVLILLRDIFGVREDLQYAWHVGHASNVSPSLFV